MSINGTSIQTRADSKDDVHNFSRTLKNGLDDNLLDEPRASAVDELYCLRKVKLHGWGHEFGLNNSVLPALIQAVTYLDFYQIVKS